MSRADRARQCAAQVAAERAMLAGDAKANDAERAALLAGFDADRVRAAGERLKRVGDDQSKSIKTMRLDRPLRVVEGNPDSPPVPERPCCRCGEPFQPTLRRRMLCAYCYGADDSVTRRGGDVLML